MSKKGFTLIELLVVISIIGLLSSVVLASLNSARAKARDVKRVADLRSVQLALQLYYDKYGVMPPNSPSGNPTAANFAGRMQPLVAEGFLSSIPVDPVNSGALSYRYHNYGQNHPAGGIIVTVLEVASDTTTGISPSCRPWPISGQNNWCTRNTASKQYCICNPH